MLFLLVCILYVFFVIIIFAFLIEMERKRELPWGIHLTFASANAFAKATGSNVIGDKEYKSKACKVHVTYTREDQGAVTATFRSGLCTS